MSLMRMLCILFSLLFSTIVFGESTIGAICGPQLAADKQECTPAILEAESQDNISSLLKHLPANSGNTPLAHALESLEKNYGEANKLNRSSDIEAYYRALREVIKNLDGGPELISCFENQNPQINAPFQVWSLIDDWEQAYQPDVLFTQSVEKEPGKDGPKRFQKIVIDFRPDPMYAVVVLAHELRHACFSSGPEWKALEESCEAGSDEACLEMGHRGIADEIRGHQTEIKVFKELAKEFPNKFCEVKVNGNGKQLYADFLKETENKIQSKDFISSLITNYVNKGVWNRSDVYGPDGKIHPNLQKLIDQYSAD